MANHAAETEEALVAASPDVLPRSLRGRGGGRGARAECHVLASSKYDCGLLVSVTGTKVHSRIRGSPECGL